jgi:tetratricopeptide (TPR) repeat protein
LPEEFHDDISAFFTECLVRAAELRLRRLPAAQLADQVNAAENNGYVLVRPLMAALAKFEMSEPAMNLYFPDLVRSIDVAAEVKRLQTVTFPPASQEQAAGGDNFGADVTPSARVSLEAALAAGERAIAAQDAPGAQAAFERVLARTPGQPRALYGLAVAFVLQRDGERARELFKQVVAAASQPDASLRPDPVALAWSHIYLGRMDDLEGNREDAVAEYQAALSVADAPESARVAAQRGIDQGYRPPEKSSSPG